LLATLDSLSDSDFKRVDEVCGLLAEKGTELGGPSSDHLEGAVWELRIRRGRYWKAATRQKTAPSHTRLTFT